MRRAAIVAAVGLALSGHAAEAVQAKPRQTVTKTYKKTKQTFQRKQLPHPKGCPTNIPFCGCGTAVEIFNAPIRALWLAANWFQFPKAKPAPGMVAVKKGHVFKIEKVLGPKTVLAKNHNSKDHKSYLQVMSLSGYSIVNPRG